MTTQLRNRSRQPLAQDDVSPRPSSHPPSTKQPRPTANLRSLFLFLLAFRLINALAIRTFFQPDEHYQTTEIAHRIVFGYGFKSWEWSSSGSPSRNAASYLTASASNLLNGPIRSILHPLLFVPGYTLLKWTALDQTYALILFPRIQQAVVAAIGDFYTFRLAHRVGGATVAWFATLVGLSNLYTLFTATRTFSNSTEAAVTAAALFYWPFVPFFSGQFDVVSFSSEEERAKLRESRDPGCVWQRTAPRSERTQYDRDLDDKQVSRAIYDRTLRTSLALAAFACLLRPTNGVLWVCLASELSVRQLQSLRPKASPIDNAVEAQSGSVLPMLEIVGEAGTLVGTLGGIGSGAVGIALIMDTTYDYFANQVSTNGGQAVLPALSLVSFLHKNVVANLSLFYGANPWHWYISQGVPVLCTVWLPATLYGLIDALQQPSQPVARQQGVGPEARRSLARLVCVTVAVYSLLGHKEFRFLQPLLPALTVLAASGLAKSYIRNKQMLDQANPVKQLWRTLNLLPLWLRAVLLTLQPIAAIYLTSIHAVAQEQVPYELGRIYRQQQLAPAQPDVEFGSGFGRIHNFGFLMPCHSTPWATHLHDRQLVERSWFIECPPPPKGAGEYWDQSDFFYSDPIKYIVDRFPYNVDTDYPANPPPSPNTEGWDKGWRHSWPSHLVVFESLLKEGTRKVGHTRTLKNLLSLKGYREVARYWNSPKHEDARREGDVVVLAYKGPKTQH